MNDGIIVDEYLRTIDPDIFAIGDCADHQCVRRRTRAPESCRMQRIKPGAWRGSSRATDTLSRCPLVLDRSIRNPLPDGGLVGHTRPRLVIKRGSIESHKFSVFYFKPGQMLAVDSVNRFGDHIAARKMPGRGTPLTPRNAGSRAGHMDLKGYGIPFKRRIVLDLNSQRARRRLSEITGDIIAPTTFHPLGWKARSAEATVASGTVPSRTEYLLEEQRSRA